MSKDALYSLQMDELTAEWVKAARAKAGLTQEQLGDLVGRTKANVGHWEKGKHSPSYAQMIAISKVTNHPLPVGADLAYEDPTGVSVALEVKSPTSTDYLPGFQALSIPVLAQAGSMGHGEDQMHDEVVIGRLTVSPEWALKTLKPTKLENLRFIHGYGDSMEGTFADGDILLVDSGVTDPKIDGVYVLEANQRIYIKRVRQRMDGAFEISSDNPNVKTVDVLDGRAQVTVHGRVIWAWNGKKM